MAYVIELENIKCGGCANSIKKRLLQDDRVSAVDVDIDGGTISIDGEEAARADIVAALTQMGYPEVGSLQGMRNAAAKAKSFVSCAVGRIDNAD